MEVLLSIKCVSICVYMCMYTPAQICISSALQVSTITFLQGTFCNDISPTWRDSTGLKEATISFN